jgi:hypothetical protein
LAPSWSRGSISLAASGTAVMTTPPAAGAGQPGCVAGRNRRRSMEGRVLLVERMCCRE